MEWLGYIHTMSADWTGQELDGQHMAEIGYILDQCQRGYGLSVCSIKGVEKNHFLSIHLIENFMIKFHIWLLL